MSLHSEPWGVAAPFPKAGGACDHACASTSMPQLYLILAASKMLSSWKPPGNSRYNNRGDEEEAEAHAQPHY